MKRSIATLALCIIAACIHAHAQDNKHEWNWGDVIATPRDGTWWEVDTRTRGCSPMSTGALRDTERALIQAGIAVSHGISASDDGGRGASWSYMKGEASQVAFSRRFDCQYLQQALVKAQKQSPFCDHIAGIFAATVSLRSRGHSEAEAYALVRKSGATRANARVDNTVIKQVYEFPEFQGLSDSEVVQKGHDQCMAMDF
ncbi:hypothetical protein CR51_27295 [Caballeronia megalochromosomata]|nr:hypothetical protein CR51_27295 [Caballeronia megalochromosomata]